MTNKTQKYPKTEVNAKTKTPNENLNGIYL